VIKGPPTPLSHEKHKTLTQPMPLSFYFPSALRTSPRNGFRPAQGEGGGPFFASVSAYPTRSQGVCVYAREKGTTPRAGG
jgi:hypothetical protein